MRPDTAGPATVGVAAVLLLLAASAPAPAITPAQLPSAAPVSDSGMVCTTDPDDSFTLTASDGYVGFPDGNTVYMWSYADGSGDFQLPGPTLCVTQGDTVTVRLDNTLPEPVSVTFPGQQGVQADAAPVQPQLDAGRLTSMVQPAAANGGSVTYSFVAGRPGTYYYESGTDMAKQVQMGLYGALVVRPANPATAYGSAASRFNPDTEYLMLMSEVDPDLHAAVENGQPYDASALRPRYWLLNGRSFPDTIAPNGASWLGSQPYGAMLHIQPFSSGANPDPALVRYINVGTRPHPFHPHGNHGRIIGRDGFSLVNGADRSSEHFLADVAPGQTWDVTYDWRDVEHWNATTNPIPVPLPQQQNLTYKDDATWYSGSPYLGDSDDLPVGVTTYNECGEYYFMWHSHALNEAANYEAGFGGMMTLERIDPPGGCP